MSRPRPRPAPTPTPTPDDSTDLITELLRLVDEPVVILDSNGRILRSSPGFERILGYQPSDLPGTHCVELLPENERATFLHHLHSLASGTNPGAFSATLRAHSGSSRTAQVLLSPVAGPSDFPAAVLCRLLASGQPRSLGDISMSQLRQLWELLDTVPVGFSYLDTNQRLLFVNKEGLRNVPDGPANIIGMHVQDVFGAERYATLKPQIDLVLSGKESTSEVSIVRRDGTSHHFLRHLYPHKKADGTLQGYFSALVDISEAKISQEAQLRREQLLRSTLVREINHRVKNSLQGLIGIMRMNEARLPGPSPLVDHCVSQLMAVAVAFGLASKHGESRILLCDMARDIAQAVQRVSHRRIIVDLLPGVEDMPVPLSEQHSVNISLVINELIFNAVKHSPDTPDRNGVKVLVDRIGETAILKVINVTGKLPQTFSFADGEGLGTGLNLVKVLVPPDSCELTISQEAEGVVATLRLQPPITAAT